MEENRERWEEAQLVSIAPFLKMRIHTVTPSVIISLQMRTVIITVLNLLNWQVRHCNKGPGGQTAHLYFFSHWQRYKERWEEKGGWTEIAFAMTNSANVSAHLSICRTHLLVPHCLCFCPAVRPFHRCVTILATEVCQVNKWGSVFTLDAKKTLVFKKQNGYSSSRKTFYHQLSKSHCFYRFFIFDLIFEFSIMILHEYQFCITANPLFVHLFLNIYVHPQVTGITCFKKLNFNIINVWTIHIW